MQRLRGAAFCALLAAGALAAGAAPAEPPRVLADIPPVHALAAQVMAGVGAPELIVPPGASPHGYALRPSEAAALEQADIVFWIGEALSPWLHDAIEALAADAASVELAEAPGVVRLPFRMGATFEKHVHGDADDHGHDHAHEAKADAHDHGHDHAHEAKAESHDHDHGHDDDHAFDSHLWLDPENAKAWLTAMATALSQADPENASRYFANAAAAQSGLDALTVEIAETVAPARDKGFIVFHDAYQYFERRFGLSASGSIVVGDGAQPSAARLAEIRAKIDELGATCVFSEPQFPPRVIDTVVEGTQARKGALDPLGASLELGPDLYAGLLRNMARDLTECLAD
jgi:zinc transport system substrate-binding protein